MHLWLLFVWTKIVRWVLLHSAWLSKLKFCRDSQLILCDIMSGMSASTCRRDLGRSEMYFRTMHKQHNHGTSWRPGKFAKPGGFNGWCIQLDVYFMENPNQKWMIWGYPHFRKPPYILLSIYSCWDSVAVDRNRERLQNVSRLQRGFLALVGDHSSPELRYNQVKDLWGFQFLFQEDSECAWCLMCPFG